MNKTVRRIIRPVLISALSAVILAAAACSGSDTSETSIVETTTAAINEQSSTAALSGSVTTTGSLNSQSNTSVSGSPGVSGRGGGLTGTVSEINGSTITLATQNGDITVTLSDSTNIRKTAAGTSADLVAGQFVQITGTDDSSGNITASEISIRDQQESGQMNSSGSDMQAGGTPPDGMSGDVSSGVSPPEMTGDGSTNSDMSQGGPPSGDNGNQGRNPGTMGTIASVGDGTMTVTTEQGDITVTFDSNTTILKIETVTTSDLSAGQTLQVRGTEDENGNIAADSITIELS